MENISLTKELFTVTEKNIKAISLEGHFQAKFILLKGAHFKIGNRWSVKRLMLCRQPLVWALNRWSCYHEYWDTGDSTRKSLGQPVWRRVPWKCGSKKAPVQDVKGLKSWFGDGENEVCSYSSCSCLCLDRIRPLSSCLWKHCKRHFSTGTNRHVSSTRHFHFTSL